jgi:hypothetical protein
MRSATRDEIRALHPSGDIMKETHGENGVGRPLEALGISADEERAYRSLLGSHTATADDVARKLDLPLRKTQRVLESIEAKGLARARRNARGATSPLRRNLPSRP